MEKNILNDATFIKHPTQEGVFMKHLFSSADNDRLNNLEVRIVPGYMIEPHVHDNSSEFYYVAEGKGEFLDGDEWKEISKGDAFKAPKGMQHGVKNTGKEMLVLFSTFSPPIK